MLLNETLLRMSGLFKKPCLSQRFYTHWVPTLFRYFTRHWAFSQSPQCRQDVNCYIFILIHMWGEHDVCSQGTQQETWSSPGQGKAVLQIWSWKSSAGWAERWRWADREGVSGSETSLDKVSVVSGSQRGTGALEHTQNSHLSLFIV